VQPWLNLIGVGVIIGAAFFLGKAYTRMGDFEEFRKEQPKKNEDFLVRLVKLETKATQAVFQEGKFISIEGFNVAVSVKKENRTVEKVYTITPSIKSKIANYQTGSTIIFMASDDDRQIIEIDNNPQKIGHVPGKN
jgi:hypothetical protein